MTEAIFNTEEVISVSAETVEGLKRRAREAARGRFRLCLHRSHGDAIQEMVIACTQGTYLRPHRSRCGGDKSYHVIDGELAFFLFDEDGHVSQRIDMGAPGSGKPFHVRYSAGVWHMPVMLSESVVYFEFNPGPFRKGVDPEYAPWSLAEDDDRATEYLTALSQWRGDK